MVQMDQTYQASSINLLASAARMCFGMSHNRNNSIRPLDNSSISINISNNSNSRTVSLAISFITAPAYLARPHTKRRSYFFHRVDAQLVFTSFILLNLLV